MKRKLFIIASMCIIFISGVKGQGENETTYEFLPAGTHFMPLKANFQEARIGILYYPDNANLKVDIGNTIDLIAINFSHPNSKLTFGIDFMAYALSTSFHGNRLQIDAIDGFFGGNASYSKSFKKSRLLSRFRIFHNSAHFVDGHYDTELGQWKKNQEPIPFTRDLGELTIGYESFLNFGTLKYYGSISYSTLVRPSQLKKYALNGGFELAFENIFGEIFSKKSNLFVAYHFSLNGLPKYSGSNHITGGIKFGSWNDKGISLYLSYFSGNNMFSEYFYNKISKFGIGFLVDFI